MPCFSVAVTVMRLAPEVSREVLQSELALEALRRYIETLVPSRPVVLQRYGDRAAAIFAGRVQVYINEGGVSVSDATLGYRQADVLKPLAEQIEERARLLAVRLVQDRALATQTAKGARVVSDVTNASGVRSVTMRRVVAV